jgi:hypothetical protein
MKHISLIRELKRVDPSQINRNSIRRVRDFRMRRMAPASEGEFRLLRLRNDLNGFGYIVSRRGTDNAIGSLPGGLIEIGVDR